MKTNGMKMFSDKVPGGAGKMSLTDCEKTARQVCCCPVSELSLKTFEK